LIDLDPVRASGIPSTDAEHQAALDKAQKIKEWLNSRGWPPPMVADSGNGAHLLYLVDLPCDDGGLLSRVLRTLDAVFSDDVVTVDVTTHNSSRLCRLYGTPNRKGDSTADRPHRIA
jgi:hypothetical protein